MSLHVASELKRMLAKQQELDPCSDEYTVLLRNIEVLAGTADMYDSIEEYIRQAEGVTVVSVKTGEPYPPDNVTPFPEHEALNETPFPGRETGEEAQAEAVGLPVMEEETADKDSRVYEMTEVRAALVEARRNGVNVTELLKEFGVENFGAFPAGKYGELMKRLGADG